MMLKLRFLCAARCSGELDEKKIHTLMIEELKTEKDVKWKTSEQQKKKEMKFSLSKNKQKEKEKKEKIKIQN